LARAGTGGPVWLLAVLILIASSLTACYRQPLRVVAVGDVNGSGGRDADAVATKQLTTAFDPNFILGLGDYQYPSGTQAEYASGFDRVWGPLVPKTFPVLAPTHDQDWRNAYPLLYWNGAGPHGYRAPVGLRALTPYSFNRHNWHFIALPDACYRVSANVCDPNRITTWLKSDLDRNDKPCTIAYWHQPYFTSRTQVHGRFTATAPWMQALVVHGVDLVLQGHQHGYERFRKQNAGGNASPVGIRSVTVGTGGAGHYDFLDRVPGSLFQNDTEFGVLRLTLQTTSNRYAGRFVTIGNHTRDSFSGTCING
jgi:hypothetical protein